MAQGRRVALQEAIPMAVQAERQEAVPVAAVPVAVQVERQEVVPVAALVAVPVVAPVAVPVAALEQEAQEQAS